jgi:hypothetical protein
MLLGALPLTFDVESLVAEPLVAEPLAAEPFAVLARRLTTCPFPLPLPLVRAGDVSPESDRAMLVCRIDRRGSRLSRFVLSVADADSSPSSSGNCDLRRLVLRGAGVSTKSGWLVFLLTDKYLTAGLGARELT